MRAKQSKKQTLSTLPFIPNDILSLIDAYLPARDLYLCKTNVMHRKTAILALFNSYQSDAIIYQQALARTFTENTASLGNDPHYIERLKKQIKRLIELPSVNMDHKFFLLQLLRQFNEKDSYDPFFNQWTDLLLNTIRDGNALYNFSFYEQTIPIIFPFIKEYKRKRLIDYFIYVIHNTCHNLWILILMNDIRYELTAIEKSCFIDSFITSIQHFKWIGANTTILLNILPEITQKQRHQIMPTVLKYLYKDDSLLILKKISNLWIYFSESEKKTIVTIILNKLLDADFEIKKSLHEILCNLQPHLSEKENKNIIQELIKYIQKNNPQKLYFICNAFRIFSEKFDNNNFHKKNKKQLEQIIFKAGWSYPNACLSFAALFPLFNKDTQIAIQDSIRETINDPHWFPENDPLQVLNPFILDNPPVVPIMSILESPQFKMTFLITICPVLIIMRDHVSDNIKRQIMFNAMELFDKEKQSRASITNILIAYLPAFPKSDQQKITIILTKYLHKTFAWETRLLVCKILSNHLHNLGDSQKSCLLRTLKKALVTERDVYCKQAAPILASLVPQLDSEQIKQELNKIFQIFIKPSTGFFQENTMKLYIELICHTKIQQAKITYPKPDFNQDSKVELNEKTTMTMFMRFYKPYIEPPKQKEEKASTASCRK